MLGQWYTTPMVTVVCPVTSLHHIWPRCNLLPPITVLHMLCSASVISLFAHDLVIPMICGFISSTIKFIRFSYVLCS